MLLMASAWPVFVVRLKVSGKVRASPSGASDDRVTRAKPQNATLTLVSRLRGRISETAAAYGGKSSCVANELALACMECTSHSICVGSSLKEHEDAFNIHPDPDGAHFVAIGLFLYGWGWHSQRLFIYHLPLDEALDYKLHHTERFTALSCSTM